MKRLQSYTLLFVTVLCVSMLHNTAAAQTKLSSLVNVKDARDTKLIGYGLVTGLNRTGDRTLGRRGSAFTVQSIASMLNKFGINVNPATLRTRNVAAVMVTAEASAYNAPGSDIDVTVSSLGDARSLRGGVLLQTPLLDPNTEEVYAYAQGSLVLGGVSVNRPGASISRNQSLTGTIPRGASVTKNKLYIPTRDQPLGLVLQDPSYTNANRIVEAINDQFESEIASATNAGYVNVEWPDGFENTGDLNFFTSTVMDLEIEVETPARVVINERTGTIVAGGNVQIGSVLVSHGNVEIRTQQTPFVSQPGAFSGGETVVGEVTGVELKENAAKNLVLEEDTNVTDLAESLNNLGFTPRDIISIFQAIARAGALQGELVIL